MYVYSTEGEPVGFVHGTFIHDEQGRPLGRIVGSRVHRFDGSYVGEWFKEMVVERPDRRARDLTPVAAPPSQPPPEKASRRRAVIHYGYADAFARLAEAAPPLAERPPEPAEASPPAEPDTVLLVDDEPKVRETIGHALRELGFRVQEARSGSEALEMLRSSRPQLAILDFLMPDMDGAEVAREVNRIDPDLPIVFSTGHSALRALRNAAGDQISVLPKPFTLAELDAFLSERLAEARRSGLAA